MANPPVIPDSSNPPVSPPPAKASTPAETQLSDAMILRLISNAELHTQIPILARFNPNRPKPKKSCCSSRTSSTTADFAAIKLALVGINPAERIALKNFLGISGKLSIRYRVPGQVKAKVVTF